MIEMKKILGGLSRLALPPGLACGLLAASLTVACSPNDADTAAASATSEAAEEPMTAEGPLQLVEGWPQVPDGVPIGFASWIDVDDRGRVYVLRRCPAACSDGPHPVAGDPPGAVLMFDHSGAFLGEWPQPDGGLAREAHGLHVDHEGFVWTTDVQGHDVKKHRADGTLVMKLGTTDMAGETDTTFNMPTHVFVSRSGEIYVTDGYGNQRMVKLDANGKFVKAWGSLGTGPGQFRIPHSVTRDVDGNVVVADRCGLGATGCTDGRLQIFDADGNFLRQWTPPDGLPFTPHVVDADNQNRIYISDSSNRKIWVLEGKTLNVIETIDGVSAHGMSVSPSGSDVYLAQSTNGVRRYTREGGH